MGKIFLEITMSLDGFVAGPNDGPDNPLGDGGERLFAWYRSGTVPLPLPGTDMVFYVSQASAGYLKETWQEGGAMIAGRRMFDIANAWGGKPPGGKNCFILTHHPPQEWIKEGSPFTFVTGGIESAVRQARQAAGEANISVSSASVAQQAIRAGLLDEIHIDLVPLLLGSGVRLFDRLGVTPIDLEQIGVVEGQGVTHLRYRVIQ